MNQNEQDNNRRASTIEEIAMMLTDLRGCRKNAGITLREVEKKTGISNAYLSQLETGKITNPSYKEVVLPLYQLYFNVQHARVVLHEQDNKPERTEITVNRIEPFTCEAFAPNGESLGLLNEYEYNDLRIQIKEAKATGYYMVFNGNKIRIDHSGNMEDYPRGFYDTLSTQLFKLI